MADLLTTIFGVLQILLQFAAAYLAYRIYLYNRISKAWLAIVVAFILMGFRRITALMTSHGYLPQFSGVLSWIDKFGLPSLISIFILCGIYSMFKNFDSFDFIEKDTERKIFGMNKTNKKSKKKINK